MFARDGISSLRFVVRVRAESLYDFYFKRVATDLEFYDYRMEIKRETQLLKTFRGGKVFIVTAGEYHHTRIQETPT